MDKASGRFDLPAPPVPRWRTEWPAKPLASPVRTWTHGVAHVLCSASWQAIAGTLAVLGLLLAFHQVVSGGVQQADLRHKAVAMQAAAIWRCNVLGTPSTRDGCLAALTVAHLDATTVGPTGR